jgi:hypothetical protein
LVEAIVTGQHGARKDPSVFGSFDVVLHIADK